MTPTTDPPLGRRVELDQVFSALSRAMRRRILVAIVEQNPRDENEFTTAEFAPDDVSRERIAVELHHTHLPHLDEAGYVDWDEETGTVTRGEDFADVRPLLELMDDHREELPGDWP